MRLGGRRSSWTNGEGTLCTGCFSQQAWACQIGQQLKSELVHTILEHFQSCLQLATGEAIIGEGGLRSVIVKEQSDANVAAGPQSI